MVDRDTIPIADDFEREFVQLDPGFLFQAEAAYARVDAVFAERADRDGRVDVFDGRMFGVEFGGTIGSVGHVEVEVSSPDQDRVEAELDVARSFDRIPAGERVDHELEVQGRMVGLFLEIKRETEDPGGGED